MERIQLTDATNLNEIIHEKATFCLVVFYSKEKASITLFICSESFQTRNFRYIRSISNENYTYAEFEAKFEDIIVNGMI